MALLLVLNVAPRLSAEWLLGKPELQYLVLPLSILVFSYALSTVVFGHYRGCLAMTRANVLSLMNYAVIPLLAIVAFWRRNSIPLITMATALPIIGVSVLLAVPLFVRFRPKIRELTRTLRELLAYGVPRVPGDFASGAIFSVASIAAAHYLPLPQVASLLLGIGVLIVIGASVNPLNQVLLSKISMMLSQNRWAQARESLEYLLTAALEISVFICLQTVVFADVIIRFWVGPKFLEQMLVIRILLAATPFYLFFTTLRSAIDAASVKPLNARNIVVASAVVVASLGAAVKLAPRPWLLDSIGASLLVGIIVLAGLTARTLHGLYGLRLQWSRSRYPLLTAATLGAASALSRWVERFDTGVVAFFVTEVIVGVLFLGVLKKARSGWLEFFSTMLLRRRNADRESVLANNTTCVN